MMAVEVREYPSISTRSKGIAAADRPSRIASPLRPPAKPVARTGTPKVLRLRATFMPLPPASVMLSGARWRCPRVRLGTTSVRATAAFKVVRPEVLGAKNEAEARNVQRRSGREAKATASLSPPHTIQVFAFGLTG